MFFPPSLHSSSFRACLPCLSCLLRPTCHACNACPVRHVCNACPVRHYISAKYDISLKSLRKFRNYFSSKYLRFAGLHTFTPKDRLFCKNRPIDHNYPEYPIPKTVVRKNNLRPANIRSERALWCTRGGKRQQLYTERVLWCTEGGKRRPSSTERALWCTEGGKR